MNGRCAFVEYRELRNGTLLLKYNDRSYPCHMIEEPEHYKIYIGQTKAFCFYISYYIRELG